VPLGSIFGLDSSKSATRPAGSTTNASSAMRSNTPRSLPPIMHETIIMMATSSPARISPLATFSAPMQSVMASPLRWRMCIMWPQKPARVERCSSTPAWSWHVDAYRWPSSSSIANSRTVLISVRTWAVEAAACSLSRRTRRWKLRVERSSSHWPRAMSGSGAIAETNMSRGAIV